MNQNVSGSVSGLDFIHRINLPNLLFSPRIYENAHVYHINSISLNSDDETYLSADDLRINLWHLDSVHECFNVVDIKPANMEELTEVSCEGGGEEWASSQPTWMS